MPVSAEDPAAVADAALLTQAAEAFNEGRVEEGAALLARVGADAQHLHHYWLVAAVAAMLRQDMAGAVAAQARACELHRVQYGVEPPDMVLDLARLAVAAGQGAVAAEARARAEAAVLAQKPRREQAAGIREALDRLDRELAPLLWQEGRHDEAIAAQVRHLCAVPDDLAALRAVRRALALGDRLLEALLVQMRVALLEPEAAGPARDMGQLLRALGAETAARAWLRRALALQPDDARTQAMLEEDMPAQGGAGGPAADPADPLVQRLARPMEGLGGAPGDPVWPMAVARALGATRDAVPLAMASPSTDREVLVREAALAALRRVLVLRPDHAEAAASLAALLREDDADTVAALRGALKLAPRDTGLHVRLGYALQEAGRMHEAQRSFRTALSLDPDQPQAMVGLAAALQAVGPSEEAVALADRALALDPRAAPEVVQLVRAMALRSVMRLEEAVAAFGLVLEADPGHAGGHFGRGLALLTMGRLEEGWPGYAWRWRNGMRTLGGRAPHDPLVRPDPAAWQGRTVLLYSEQAQGDTIQFLRYARMVAECGARVLLEVHGPLKRIAATIPDLAGVYGRGEMVPPFDESVPLLHLPWAFGTTLETIPATVPYLRGDLVRAAGFRRRLAGLPGLKVGLVWSGDPRPEVPDQALMDGRRSVRLAELAPLAQVPGLVFVSLQKGAPAKQAAEPPAGMVLHDWTDELEDFTDTAALMTALDLVISVDTAPAHLAGALGRPVWLLNRFDTDFRWLVDREDSPWYPTMRQFRQVRPGAWDEVIARVAEALRERVGRGG